MQTGEGWGGGEETGEGGGGNFEDRLDYIRLDIMFLSRRNARAIRAAFPGESEQP